jgi:hypothetical protein
MNHVYPVLDTQTWIPDTTHQSQVSGDPDEDQLQVPDEDHPQNLPQDQPLGLAEQMDLRYGPRTSHYDLRARRPRVYGHLHAVLQHTTFTQYSFKQGLKQFGSDGEAAVQAELKQLHDRKVVKPVHPSELTPDERHDALGYLMFLKQKRTGQVKGRVCRWKEAEHNQGRGKFANSSNRVSVAYCRDRGT